MKRLVESFLAAALCAAMLALIGYVGYVLLTFLGWKVIAAYGCFGLLWYSFYQRAD